MIFAVLFAALTVRALYRSFYDPIAPSPVELWSALALVYGLVATERWHSARTASKEDSL